MHLIIGLLFALAGWKWGDWRNWQKYYPTILFVILIDLLYNIFAYNHSMWEFNTSFDSFLLPNHTTISMIVDFMGFPATVLIYLGRYPHGKKLRVVLYTAMWVLIFTSIEYTSLYLWNGIDHYHGWNIWWSILINVLTFPVIWLHYKSPLWAWLIAIIAIAFFWILFDLPLEKMK